MNCQNIYMNFKKSFLKNNEHVYQFFRIKFVIKDINGVQIVM